MNRARLGRLGLLLTSALVFAGITAAPSNAAPQMEDIVVHSASMNRDIPLTVLKPKDTSKPAPVLYLLNGAGGGEDTATWQRNTDDIPR